MKATEAFLHKCVIFISTPIYKSSFLFGHITLHQWYLSKTKIKPMSTNLSPPPEGQVCAHASPTCTALPACWWGPWPQHTHFAFQSLVHMLEADRKSDRHPCKHPDRHYCHRPVQDGMCKPYAQSFCSEAL